MFIPSRQQALVRAGRFALALLLKIVLASCGGGVHDGAPPATPRQGPAPGQESSPAPTAVGAPQGVAASTTIDAAGGALASADGWLMLTVPPGAFAQPTTVTIQPIRNTAHGAKGGAYRITPEGLVSAVPMSLRFSIDDAALAGTDFGELNVATQDAQGRWHARRAPLRDAAARTLTVGTQHFSDWAVIAGVQLRPGQAEVPVGGTIDLALVRCASQPDLGDPETSTVSTCSEEMVAPGELGGWAVNGTRGGSPGSGFVAELPRTDPRRDGDSSRARFSAPLDPPPRNPVAVSVDYAQTAPDANPLRLVSQLSIVTADRCGWLRHADTLDYRIELGYTFTGSGPDGSLSLDQGGVIEGEVRRVDAGDLYGTWYGLTTRGQAALNDWHRFGDRTSRLLGNGAPAIGEGIDQNQISGATVVVDFRRCTYSVTAQIAVLSTSGEPNDPPRVHVVGGFTRGDVAIDPLAALAGFQRMPPRLDPGPEGTYAPGGLGLGLIADGYASEVGAGTALVRWEFSRALP